MNKILVVNVNWLGDVIFSVPVFKALKAAYPQAKVSCLAVPRVGEVLQMCPFVDEVIIYDEDDKHRHFWKKLKIANLLRSKKFDAAFLLHRSLTRALIIFLAGIPKRVGYTTKTPRWLLTHPVQSLNGDAHRSLDYLNVVESFGIAVFDQTCQLSVPQSESNAIQRKLAENGIGQDDKFVVLNPGGNWDLKRWPQENFAALTRNLVEQFKVRVVISGADKDQALAKNIAQESKVNPVVLAGQTKFKELAALFYRAQVVISADTGPLHLASGVGTKTIALFGPTRPEITGPRGSGKRTVLHNDVGCNKTPCYHLACGQNVCMQSITVDDVLQAFQKIRNQ